MAELVLVDQPALIWPTTLPQCPQRPDSNFSDPYNGLRSSVDAGPAKERRWSFAQYDSHQCVYLLNRKQLDYLRAFARSCVGQFFRWPHPLGDKVTLAARVKPKSEKEMFEFASAGGAWFKASLSFETVPDVTFTESLWPWLK